MATYVYREAFGTGQLRFGFSAAASVVLFAMIMAFTVASQSRRPGRRGGAVRAPAPLDATSRPGSPCT